MTIRPRHTREEFARLGGDIYDRNVRPKLGPSDIGKYVAIDIESGQFEVDVDDYAATERLTARNPDAQIWLVRAGHSATYRIGGRSALGHVE